MPPAHCSNGEANIRKDRLSRQQGGVAEQAVPGLRPADELAAQMGGQLG
jgi:hypothetical protein